MTSRFLLTAVALVAIAAAAPGCKKESKSPGDAGTPAAASGDGGVASKPEVKLEGVDTGSLTPRERGEWSKWVSEIPAPCADVAVPIAQCVTEKRACAKCLPAANYLLKLVRAGKVRAEAEVLVKQRFVPVDIPIDGSPTLGPDNAPVTIIEFADFQCPGCAREAPLLRDLIDKLGGRVRLVYKFAALEKHPRAEAAARAAIAAWHQGKFWEMHQRIFEVTHSLERQGPPPFEDSDLQGYARDLHLDMAKFIDNVKSPATNQRFDADMKLFEKYNLGGTPSIYINGMAYNPEEEPDLLARVTEVLSEIKGGDARPLAVDAGAPAPSDAGARPDAKAR